MVGGHAVRFLNRELCSPLVLPSGILGVSSSSLARAARAGAGLVTTKSFTAEPRAGHPGPVVVPVEGGLLNAVGLANPGIREGVAELARSRAEIGAAVAVSVFAAEPHGFGELASVVEGSGADFLELNLSCPNVSAEYGTPLAASPEAVAQSVRYARQRSTLPVIAKLSPNVTDIAAIAQAAVSSGADALCLINTVGPGMKLDPETGRPLLSNGSGGLSGPCIRPIAVRIIHEVARRVNVPIIGVGGVGSAADVREMQHAGAALVGIGTAVRREGPEIFTSVLAELEEMGSAFPGGGGGAPAGATGAGAHAAASKGGGR